MKGDTPPAYIIDPMIMTIAPTRPTRVAISIAPLQRLLCFSP
jgi:hypothetical protein